MKSLIIEMSGGKKLGVKEFLQLFTQFSKADQIKIAENIARQTFADRWALLDQALPDLQDITEEEILAEIKAVRHGQKETP